MRFVILILQLSILLPFHLQKLFFVEAHLNTQHNYFYSLGPFLSKIEFS